MESGNRVDRIIRHRSTKAGHQYFVKWLNHTSKRNSWESGEQFHSDVLINEYHARIDDGAAASNAKMASNNKKSEMDAQRW